MGYKTKIDWCDSTWNPVTGCQHDCEYCYARSLAKRYGGYDHDEDGKHASQNGWLLADEVVGMLENPCTLVSYGATWRLWKYRPSDKERREYKWP